MRTTAGALLAVALGMGVSACGDDTAALPKSEYVEAANAICGEANAEVEPIWEEFWASLPPDDQDTDAASASDDMFDRFVVVVDETAEVWGDSLDDLRALGEPEGDEERLERLYDDFETAIGDFQQLVRDAADGSEDAREALDGEGEDPFTEINARARVYGLTVCGTD